MSEVFQYELVTPERRVSAGEAVEIVLPGAEGDFGVLAGHAPVMAGLRPGLIEIRERDADAPTRRVFVKGGFAQVTDERVILLVEECLDPAETSLEDLKRRIHEREIDLGDARDDLEREAAENDLRWMRALAEVLERGH